MFSQTEASSFFLLLNKIHIFKQKRGYEKSIGPIGCYRIVIRGI
ncbi:MAG: hypothetical protein K0S26_3062 [Bacteroidota bacterium]|jgi:hypothetical protein|nr:hypothetical protein [Bacteroidota bacterium]